MKTLSFFLFTLLFLFSAQARPIRAWTYQELFNEADQVVVATGTKKVDLVDFMKPPYLPDDVGAFQVTFKVLGTFKGKETESLILNFYKMRIKTS
jgi:hypothetical protein